MMILLGILLVIFVLGVIGAEKNSEKIFYLCGFAIVTIEMTVLKLVPLL